MHEFQEAWFSLKIIRRRVFTLIQKSFCAWNTVMKVELDYQENHTFVLQVFPQKRQLDVKIAVWFPWFYQIFRKNVNCCYQQRQQHCLAIIYDIKTFKMK